MKKQVMSWCIRHKDNDDLYWDNEWGWVEDGWNTYSQEERETLRLPIGGK